MSSCHLYNYLICIHVDCECEIKGQQLLLVLTTGGFFSKRALCSKSTKYRLCLFYQHHKHSIASHVDAMQTDDTNRKMHLRV